jgi:hypothetical protein
LAAPARLASEDNKDHLPTGFFRSVRAQFGRSLL